MHCVIYIYKVIPFPHNMYIMYIEKDNLCSIVGILTLKPSTFRLKSNNISYTWVSKNIHWDLIWIKDHLSTKHDLFTNMVYSQNMTYLQTWSIHKTWLIYKHGLFTKHDFFYKHDLFSVFYQEQDQDRSNLLTRVPLYLKTVRMTWGLQSRRKSMI